MLYLRGGGWYTTSHANNDCGRTPSVGENTTTARSAHRSSEQCTLDTRALQAEPDLVPVLLLPLISRSRQRTTPHFWGGRHDGTHRYLSQMQRSPAHSRYQTGCKVLRTWTYAPGRHVYGVASEARSRTDAGGEQRCWVVVRAPLQFLFSFSLFVSVFGSA